MSITKTGLTTSNLFIELPNQYKRIEYIQGTGTQYIETNYIPKSNYRYNISFELDAFCKSNSTLSFIFSSYKAGNRYDVQGRANSIVIQTGNSSDLIINASLNTRYDLEITASTITLNNTQYSSGGSFLGSNGCSFQIFYDTRFPGPYYALMKLYSSQIYEGDDIIRNFIPVIRISDNKPGLYDTVYDIFYTNSGTGEFVSGPDVGNNVGIYTDKIISNSFMEI